MPSTCCSAYLCICLILCTIYYYIHIFHTTACMLFPLPRAMLHKQYAIKDITINSLLTIPAHSGFSCTVSSKNMDERWDMLLREEVEGAIEDKDEKIEQLTALGLLIWFGAEGTRCGSGMLTRHILIEKMLRNCTSIRLRRRKESGGMGLSHATAGPCPFP